MHQWQKIIIAKRNFWRVQPLGVDVTKLVAITTEVHNLQSLKMLVDAHTLVTCLALLPHNLPSCCLSYEANRCHLFSNNSGIMYFVRDILKFFQYTCWIWDSINFTEMAIAARRTNTSLRCCQRPLKCVNSTSRVRRKKYSSSRVRRKKYLKTGRKMSGFPVLLQIWTFVHWGATFCPNPPLVLGKRGKLTHVCVL